MDTYYGIDFYTYSIAIARFHSTGLGLAHCLIYCGHNGRSDAYGDDQIFKVPQFLKKM